MPLLTRAAAVALVVAPCVLLDQATKSLARMGLAPGEVVELLPFLNLRLGFNRGVSFGFAQAESLAGVWGLISVTSAIALGLVAWAVRTVDSRERLALSLVLAGAMGNLIDRVRDGMVTDFVDLHVAGYHWPTFNVADIAITMGAGLLVFRSLKSDSRRRQEVA